MARYSNFRDAITVANGTLKQYGAPVDTGRWQGVATGGKPDLVTKELLNLQFEVPLERASWHDDSILYYPEELAGEIKPNLPWADEHFAERVGGVPMNPDPSHVNWPWWRGQYKHTASQLAGLEAHSPGADALKIPPSDFRFTHTYSERFWPTKANWVGGEVNHGIRYRYGDYNDVLDLLAEDPFTRQAYLPIFFPEDTGAVHRGRIPCSLGYHFMVRRSLSGAPQLHCWYEIRSCDAVRHFRDDLYLAARLVAHTIEQLFERELRSNAHQIWVDVDPGTLYFTAHSFHVHKGDMHLL